MCMPKAYYLMIILAFIIISCNQKNIEKFKYEIRFETSQGKETSTYNEMMNFYKAVGKYHSAYHTIL